MPTPTPQSQAIRVWDLPVRLFHWLLVLLVALLWYTGEVGGLDLTLPWPGEGLFLANMDLHMLLGQTLLALVLFRILWGLFGSTTARFSSFVRGPKAVAGYLRAALSGTPPAVVGHNPAGALMVVLFLMLLGTQAGVGLFANDDIFSEGPLAHLVSSDTSAQLTRIHGILFNVLLGAIALHVLAVLVYWQRGKNLIRPMITGRFPRDSLAASDSIPLQFRSSLLALFLLVLSGLAVWALRWL